MEKSGRRPIICQMTYVVKPSTQSYVLQNGAVGFGTYVVPHKRVRHRESTYVGGDICGTYVPSTYVVDSAHMWYICGSGAEAAENPAAGGAEMLKRIRHICAGAGSAHMYYICQRVDSAHMYRARGAAVRPRPLWGRGRSAGTQGQV